MALVRTDYGLIYNTDGSLCATLLPDGGVAVTEGTTNLFPLEKSIVVRGDTTPYQYSVTSGLVQGGTYTLRAFIKVEPNDDTSNPRMTLRFIYSDGTRNEHRTNNFPKDGVEYEYILTKTANPDKTLVEINGWILDHGSVGPGGKYQSARNIQLEQKSFATPFTEDTRPPGRLPYDIPQLKGARDFTLHFKFLPYMFKETAWAQYLFSTRTNDYLHYYAVINDSGTRLAINTALEEDDTWVYANIYNPPININSWHRFVMTGRQEGNQATISIYLDGVEVYKSTRVGTLRPFPGILALGTNHSLSYAFNGAFRELYICPYAVSAETVATWHSLDAPFFDPREQIDAGAKTIHMYQSDINGHGHTIRDQYGNKAVFSGVDPDTGDRGYKVYDTNGSDEVVFLGARADGRRGLMMREEDMTWLDASGVSGNKVMSLPWTSLDSATQLLFSEFFIGNFIIADENGEYGFNFGDGSAQIKSYVLKATEDTYVNSLQYTTYDKVYSWRDENYGTETRLRIANGAEHNYSIGGGSGVAKYHKDAYIKFSGLSSIPASEEIVDAELRLYFTDLSATRFMLLVPRTAWSEGTITWNNQPDYYFAETVFYAKLGTTIIKQASLIGALDEIRAREWENHGFTIWSLEESKGESVLYSREGHSSLCPTLVVYTRGQTPTPGLNLHVPGGRVFLNRKIFDVSGKTLTLSANRNDITIYVYENEDGEAVIDFVHGGRAFKADSYVVLGSAKTTSSAITEISKARNTGRKEGPRGMGNDVYFFGPIDINTTSRNLIIPHELGGSRHQVEVEINPTGTSDWFRFSTAAYMDGSNKRGISVWIDSTNLYLDAGRTSVFGYIDTVGNPVYVDSAKVRGRIVRLD